MTRVLDRVSVKIIILLICLLWSVQSALATTVIRPLDDEMIVGARAIITGKVLKVETAIDEQQDRIYTYITVRVNEVIKGQITERRIILKEFGGIVGDRVSVVYGNPQFTRDERVLLYLGTHPDGSLRTYQLFLGKFSIVTDEATGKSFAVRDTGGENVTVLEAPQGHLQGDSTDRMEVSSYTEMVRTRLAVNMARSQAFEETYYKNVPVLASPPGFVSSKKKVHPEFTFLGNARWFQPDTGQPVPYTLNPNPSTVPGAPHLVVDPSEIAAAANAWSVVPGCSLRLSFSGNLNSCYTQTGTPGINVVSNNCDGHNLPTPGCAGILAIGGWSGGGFQTRILGGITFGQMTQGFVSFNPWASCHFSNRCNLQEVATHELGHALGLGHSADPSATMTAFAHFDGRCASIRQDDTNGIVFLYPGTGGGPGPLTVVTSSLSGGSVGTSYSQTLTASEGTPPYSWSVVAGLGTLPPGLSLSAAGIISGTPITIGTYNFTVRVTDAASATAQKALSIAVVAPGAPPLASQFVSQTVPSTVQPGQVFNVNMKFLNTGTQTWSGSDLFLASQNPPLNENWGGNGVDLGSFVVAPGQQLNATFQATAPATPGTYNFQWQLYQSNGVGFFGQMSTNVSITVSDPTPQPTPPSIGGPSSLEAVKGISFTYVLTAAGGTPPYTWQLASGTLPAGLALNPSTGALSGIPTVTGNFAAMVQVTDSKSLTAQKALSIAVSNPPPSIGGPSSLEAVKGISFTHVLTAAAGTPPYTWQLATGTLPAGLALNPNTGAITGKPTVTGNFGVVVQVIDSKSLTAQKALSIAVTDPPVAPVEITTSSLTQATKGVAWNQQLDATGGKPPYSWAVNAGALPAGLSLSAATGILSGTPNATGAFSFSVTANDAEFRSASRSLSITVVAPPLSMPGVPALDGLKGSSFNYQLAASGGTSPYTWSVTAGALPSGLNLNSASGLISGVPTVAGLFTLTVTVRDQASVTMSATVQITLIDPETIPAVRKVKYKGGKKLIVLGDRFNPAAVLVLDGIQTSAIVSDGSFTLKPIVLAPGTHQVRIINPGGVPSAPFIFTVQQQ